MDFLDHLTAGNATISASGPISFDDSSKGGAAQIELLFNDFFPITTGVVDISSLDAPGVTIGWLAGVQEAFVFLGANNLTVGTNNLSTIFAGTITARGAWITRFACVSRASMRLNL
jgi:hypothetical protein